MPSTHATSIAFYMGYILTSLLDCQPAPAFVRSRADRVLVGAGTAIWGGAILVSRVYLGYHTVPQVLVGAALGGTAGAGWRRAWRGVLRRRGERAMKGLVERAVRWLEK